MSENFSVYNDGSCVLTVEAFKNRPCTLPYTDPNYVAPTPEEVKALRQILGFSQTRLGAFAGLRLNKKGCKGVRRWEAKYGSQEQNPINYSAWQLMLIAAGVVDLQDRVASSEDYKLFFE